MSLDFLSLATVNPRFDIHQDDAADMAATLYVTEASQRRLIGPLYRRTRVQRRASVLIEAPEGAGSRQSFYTPAENGEPGGPTTAERMDRFAAEACKLAVAAGRQALESSDVSPDRIKHLLTVTCTGFSAPGFDVALIRELGLPETTMRTQLGFMGCHGAVNALRAAQAYVAESKSPVMVCCTELCSLHFQYGWDPEQIVANALFADGAAAVVAGPSCEGPARGWRLKGTGSRLFPDSTDAMTWKIKDHGFVMTLSSRVPDLISSHLRPWLESFVASHGYTLDQIQNWAVHPGGPRILSSVADVLSLRPGALDVSHAVLAEHGNMSSPTLLFILDRLRKTGARGPCVALGFGPGLVAEAMLLD
ncbi:MAG TPA: type III polyketide synthase [Pirellulales bacterium]